MIVNIIVPIITRSTKGVNPCISELSNIINIINSIIKTTIR